MPPKKSAKAFTKEEQTAMREHAQEMKRAAGRGPRAEKTDGAARVLAAIAAMSASDRVIAERFHALVAKNAPSLAPRLWYGMPAYAADGEVVCFFQSAQKFKTRYATIGFQNRARLDEGAVWPVAFAVTALAGADAARIGALVKKAAGPR
ncbi:MAG: hypothetical protein ACYDCK_02235 [Thermoplasmatota archaeon]